MVSTAGGIAIAVVVVLILAALGWVGFTQLRARKLGVSPSSIIVNIKLPYGLTLYFAASTPEPIIVSTMEKVRKYLWPTTACPWRPCGLVQ